MIEQEHRPESNLEAKLELLERELALVKARQKKGHSLVQVLVLGALLLGGVLAGRQSTAQNTANGVEKGEIVCKSLLIPGPDGKVQLLLTSDERGGVVIVSNRAGKNVVRLSAEPQGGLMQVRNNQSKPIVAAVASEGGGQVTVNNDAAKNIGFLGVARDGRGELALGDGAGGDALLGGSDTDGGFFVVNNANGKNALRLGAKGGGQVSLLDAEGKPRQSLP